VGSSYVTFVAEDVRADDAEQVASCVLQALVGRGVVLADPAPCLLGEDLGFEPGPGADEFRGNPNEWLSGLSARGLEIERGRQVFYSLFSEEMTCPRCGAPQPISDAWLEAVGRWHDGEERADCACAACGENSGFRGFHLDVPWGFGNLGFTFWNWTFAHEEEAAAWFAEQTHSKVVVVHAKV